MTSTSSKSHRTQTRHCKEKRLCSTEKERERSQREEIFEIVKEIVSERVRGRVGVHYEQQIVGARVVRGGPGPWCPPVSWLSQPVSENSPAIQTAVLRRLRGRKERREERGERTFVFHFAPLPHQRPCFF